MTNVVTPTLRGSGITIAVIIAYHYAGLQSDFNIYNIRFNLPKSTLQIKSFTNETNESWAMEACLDVQMAHTAAPGSTILVVEAASSLSIDLNTAIKYAETAGATIINMSWGASEYITNNIFTNTNVCYVASSGDISNTVNYPSSSPNVLSVGGTTLTLSLMNTRLTEIPWENAGAGPSVMYNKPSYQSNLLGTKRITPDVSLVANPITGVLVYCSNNILDISNNIPDISNNITNINGGYYIVGGTSLSAPLMSGILATTNQLRVSRNKPMLTTVSTSTKSQLQSYLYKQIYTNPILYSTNIYDIKTGYNGIYKAKSGYDIATGLGSPMCNNLCLELINV